MTSSKGNSITKQRAGRAAAIAKSGGVENALQTGALPKHADVTLSEAIVLGLLRQNVSKFICILGHGSTDVGEVLRVYEEAGVVKSYCVRHETAASHAAAALRMVTGEKAAVVTSIGPGALHALAGAIVPASDGVGVWYLLGDETTEDEGPNMQQIPRHEQGLFNRLFSAMGHTYSLHTPGALGAALRRGLLTVDHPHRGGPFFLLMPMNTQPALLCGFNIDALPCGEPPALGAAADDDALEAAAKAVRASKKTVVKLGAGAVGSGAAIEEFLELADAVAVLSPRSTGCIPFSNPRNMQVGGSKGSICGNHAMEEADLLVAVGTRFVCQSDCSRTGYLKAKQVVNINTDARDVTNYNRTISLFGAAAPTLDALNSILRLKGAVSANDSKWLAECSKKRAEWEKYKKARYGCPAIFDPKWNEKILTQPAAIKAATDWARENDAVAFFDAGDVQANGFQLVEDDRPGRTFTDTGASYMGFASSALLASAVSSKPFYGLALTGDGSFMMNPQIIIDGVNHGARGCVLLLDNMAMAAIASLQDAQYGKTYATSDNVRVNYVQLAGAVKGLNAMDGGRSVKSLRAALDRAIEYKGLSLIHVPVYFGPDPLGGLGAFGRWNVGNWVAATQELRHKLGW